MFIIIYHSVVQNMYNISTVHIAYSTYIITFLSRIIGNRRQRDKVVTRHLPHSTLRTFGVAVVRNTLFILLMVFFSFIRPFVRRIYLYAGARLFVFSRNFASGAREKPRPGVSAATAAVAAGRRSPLTQPATVTET